MKKTILIILTKLFVSVSSMNATVLTVSNDPSGGAQFPNLLSAYTAAAAGDTLILEGTNIAYFTNVGWAKKLTVIGIGYNPAKVNPRHTKISVLGGTTITELAPGGSGSSFFGIEFTTAMYPTGAVSSYSFADCMFDGTFSNNNQQVTGFSYKNCVFASTVITSYTITNFSLIGVSFTGCIFNCIFEGASNDNASWNFDHCLFLIPVVQLLNVHNALIESCIFMNYATIATGSSSCDFQNNMARLATSFPLAGNTGSGNIVSTNPQFVNYTLGSPYSSAFDFHLQAASPAIGVGSSGTDIGVHGSNSHFNESGETLINPIIRSLYINNSSVAPNGNLNININATKPNDN